LISSNVIPRPYTDADFFSVYEEGNNKPGPLSEANPLSSEVQSKEIKAKVKTPLKKEQSKISLENLIINSLKKVQKEGISLKELSKLIKMDQAKTRIILKDLLDREIIEKIQQKYYII